MEKDISRWIKVGWDDFKKFVDSKKEVQSKSEVKAIHKKDSIRVHQDEEKIVVIPLSKEASIHYGKNTDWCTAYTKAPNQFTKYFYIKGITLFYVLFKNGDKYACAFHPDQPDTIECFDQADNNIKYNKFSDATGISKNDIHGWYSSNKGLIMKLQDISKLDEEARIELVKDEGYVIKGIKNPSEAIQLVAVNQNGRSIQHIDNPTEKVQLIAVSQDGWMIQYIIDKGITPSEAVQLAAIEKDGWMIQYIIKKGITPSEAVQLAAIEKDGRLIQHIDNPSEEVQLMAVKQNEYAIDFIVNPSEKVKALHNKLYT